MASAATDRLEAFAEGADAGRLIEVADEILAVADLLRREPRLRRALSDPGREADQRVELLKALLSGKVGDDTVDLVGALVKERFSTPVDLLNAAERLGVDTLLASAARAEPPESRESGASAGSGPAAADNLGDVEDELFRFGQVVDGDNELAAALGDPTAEVGRRAELVGQLLADKVQPVTLRLAKLALSGFGGRGFSASLSRLVELAAARRDRSVAYVTTAVPLTDEEEDRLAARLAEMYGRQVSVKIDVDPRIIGGMRVKIGSDLYDGTVARRLAEVRTALSK
jgi:F-type H+-transporting ATPase subunit delta